MSASICGKLYDYRGFLGEGCANIDDNGFIESVTKEPRYNKIYRYNNDGLVVTPGLIDLHVHLRGLGLSYKEDERTGTMAALESGITLVADMPNTVPRLASREAVRLKLRALSDNSYVDYGVYAGIPDKPEAVSDLLNEPVLGFKVYPEDMDAKRPSVSRALSTGALVVVHPETPEADLRSQLADTNVSRAELRGCWSEALAVHMIHDMKGLRVHVTHVSCPSTLYVAKGYGYTTDTTPHYLLLDRTVDNGCYYKVNPPLRDLYSSWQLVKALKEGLVDALGSDHAPHSPEEKRMDYGLCPPGIPWLGVWPWVVFRLVVTGYLDLQEFLRLTSFGPAKVLGLSKYGYIGPGARANLVVIDLKARRRFVATYSKARYWHVFMQELVGEPKAVFVGGELAYEDGSVQGRPRALNAAAVG